MKMGPSMLLSEPISLTIANTYFRFALTLNQSFIIVFLFPFSFAPSIAKDHARR